MIIKYAFALDMLGEHAKWTLTPWRRLNLTEFARVADIPNDYVLISSHHPPWREPLKSWIEKGNNWIEIEYGYWGRDTPRRETRRVTFNGHHNLVVKTPPHSRANLFPEPKHQPWRSRPGKYILGIQPVEVILQERTGETLEMFRERLSQLVAPYWSGDILWRRKAGAKTPRFQQFQEQLQDAHAVIGERTMACTESCLLGVPGFTVDISMSTLLVGGIENINQSNWPKREAWWEHICWSQFTREEFNSDIPARLVEEYQINKSHF